MQTEPQADDPDIRERTSFSARIKAIVADGDDVRARVADAVREAAALIQETGETLGDISKSVIDEAVRSAADEVGERGSGSVLREVIDGVGDGFQSAAQAVDLAIAEARSKGHQFADEDLGAIADDLRSVCGLLVDTTGRAARRVGGHLKGQVSDLTAHAERTAHRVRPELESAASSATGDVKGMVKQTARVGISAARQGTGALFAVMGTLLQKAGEVIKVRPAVDGPNADPSSG